jgi:3-oxoadipate enol-lactonase
VEFITANGITICYEVSGDPEGDAVLIVSGTGNDLRADIARAPRTRSAHHSTLRADIGVNGQRPPHPLTQHGFSVIEYDQRGLGQTSKPDQHYTMADYADDAAALLQALFQNDVIPNETVHVVGISFGGMVAQHLAIRSPHLIDRLALCCTSTGGAGGSSFDLLAIAELPEDERVRITVEVMDTRNDMSVSPPVFAPGYLEMAKRGVRAKNLMERDPLGPMGARRQLEARANHDTWSDLPNVHIPTLVCGGIYDAQASPDNVRALSNRLPDSQLSMFDGGHAFLYQDQHAWPAIAAFLQLRSNR